MSTHEPQCSSFCHFYDGFIGYMQKGPILSSKGGLRLAMASSIDIGFQFVFLKSEVCALSDLWKILQLLRLLSFQYPHCTFKTYSLLLTSFK